MKLTSSVLIAAGLTALAGSACGQNPRGVIELFTSQGCSSCPAADRLLAKLAQDPSIIALSYPVTYWDYMGWKDTLASPAFTARQNGYASARGDGQVYTPQAVIDGVTHAVGSDSGEIATAMATAAPQGMNTVSMKVSRVRNALDVQIGAAPAATPGTIYVLKVASARTVPVGRGENAGHRLTYTNVVRSMVRAGEWNGASQTLRIPVSGGDGDAYVVLLQTGSAAQPGRILTAAKAN